MDIIPIPLFLLKDSVVLKQYKGRDKRERPIYEEITLENVFLKFSNGKIITNDGIAPSDTLKLFYDNVNSAPKGQKFNEKDKILIKNANEYGFSDAKREFSITNISPSAFNHHIVVSAV